jgi:membrane dipeptidase
VRDDNTYASLNGSAAPPQRRVEAKQWAEHLGISRHALDLYLASDVIDLHVDSFIWSRIFGYRLQRQHSRGLLNARFYSQVDVPRLRQACISGATWVITTNPFRTHAGRARAFVANVERLTQILESQREDIQLVRGLSDYVRAKQAGRHAAFIGVQGGNAVDDPSTWSTLESGAVLRVTLVHLTNSRVGCTSSPLRLRPDAGLSEHGRALIARLERNNVLVDLAHTSRKTFEDALLAHDKSRPLLVSHTGVSGVFRHWRNLTDGQLRAIADSGGIVGIFFHGPFLGGGIGGGSVTWVARHIAHAVRVMGAAHVALGSDWDGMIITPRDMPTCLELPRLIQALLDLDLTDSQIQSVLGGSFLRLLGSIRP